MYQDLSKYKYNLDRGHNKLFIFLYQVVCALFVRTSPKPFWKWRNFIYRLFGAKIGRNVQIDPDARLMYPWNMGVTCIVWTKSRLATMWLWPITFSSQLLRTIYTKRSSLQYALR